MSSLLSMLGAIWRLGVEKKPLILSHTINAECNLHCRFCPFHRRKGREMEKAEIFDMLDQSRSLGIMIYNVWATEPLLRKDLPECLEYASSRGLITSIITNGTLLEERVDELSSLDMLSVSFDGIKTYEEIRGGDVELIIRGIKKARERGLSVMLNCVLSERNTREVEALIKLAKELGASISFEPLQRYEYVPESVWDEMIIKNKDSYIRAIDSIIEMKRKGFPVVNSSTYLNMIKKPEQRFKCRANDVIMHVSLDGKIENCRDREICLGRVDEGLEQVWESSRVLRRKLAAECKGCLAFGYAEGSLACSLKLDVLINYGKHFAQTVKSRR